MTQDEIRQRAEFWQLLPACSSMRRFEMLTDALSTFNYDGLPETLPAEWLEGNLITNGTVGVGKIDGELYCAAGDYCGNYNGYLPDHYRAEVLNKGQLYGEWGKDLVVGWNNAIRTPDLDIWHTAEMLTEVDISERIVTVFTRLLRIPKAKDDAEKEAIEEAIKSLLKGDLTAVASSNTLQDLVGSASDADRFLDLVDPQQVDQLQYLNQYRDNLIKRFMQRRGHSMTITSKLAQQTNAEMHGADSYSMIYPLQQLHYRQLMCEEINRLFGTSITVEFSELVKNNYDLVVNYVPDELNERGVIDGEDQDANAAGSAEDPAEPAGADGNSTE